MSETSPLSLGYLHESTAEILRGTQRKCLRHQHVPESLGGQAREFLAVQGRDACHVRSRHACTANGPETASSPTRVYRNARAGNIECTDSIELSTTEGPDLTMAIDRRHGHDRGARRGVADGRLGERPIAFIACRRHDHDPRG